MSPFTFAKDLDLKRRCGNDLDYVFELEGDTLTIVVRMGRP